MKWDSRTALSTEATATLAGVLENDMVDVTNVMAWNNAPYFYFTDTTIITDVALTDESKVAIDASALTQPALLTEAGTLVLPATGTNGSTIVWTTDSALINLTTGAVTMPAEGQVTATVTATLTLNAVTVVLEFEVKLGEPSALVASDLFISAYVEGAPGNRKAIQIYNGTGADVVLDGVYSVKTASNGGAWSTTPVLLTGTLVAGDVYVIRQSADGNWTADITAGLNFNGDDAVGLFKNDVLLDHFGTQGTDPGTSWTIGDNVNATVDHVLVRKGTVTGPNATWDANEWNVALAIPTGTSATTDPQVEVILQSYTYGA